MNKVIENIILKSEVIVDQAAIVGTGFVRVVRDGSGSKFKEVGLDDVLSYFRGKTMNELDTEMRFYRDNHYMEDAKFLDSQSNTINREDGLRRYLALCASVWNWYLENSNH